MAKTKKKNKNKGSGGTQKKAKAAKMRSFKGANLDRTAPETTKVHNPFEIRLNKAKHDNLGRRGRHEKGVPGVSRSKAIEKRRETLLKEYKLRNKSSIFVDKRIGEKIKNMSEEEKIIRRSVVEKRRQYKQKSIFNLPSTDEILTHKGKMLMDIDRYEDPRDETDSEDERLNEDFVNEAHFAGDFLKVKEKQGNEDDDMDGKSRGDIIAELILNSKKRKMEKAKETDENYELVTKLDQEFKSPDFRSLLTFVKKDGEPKEAPVQKKEDYDKIVRELHFEAKTGQASNRLQTEEEIQDEELKKLRKLEKERLKRMQAQDPSIPRHKSADDLGDNSEEDDEVPTLTYGEDGKLTTNFKEDDEEDEGNEEESDDEAANEEVSDEDESDDDDGYSDLDSDNEVEESVSVAKGKSTSGGEGDSDNFSKNDDIPFILTLPKSYEAFVKLFRKYKALITDSDECVNRFKVVLERLVKYSLLADKSRLPELFSHLMRMMLDGVQAANSLAGNIKKIIDIATVNLHSVVLTNPSKCAALLETEVLQHVQSYDDDKFGKKILAQITLYRICSQMYCATDFIHRILSPMKVEILGTINSFSKGSYSDLLKTLSLCDVMHELTKESKRSCPEVLKLLLDILDAVSLPPHQLRLRRRRFEFLQAEILRLDESEWEWKKIDRLDYNGAETPTLSQVKSLIVDVFTFINNIIQALQRTKASNSLIFSVLRTQHRVLSLDWRDRSFHRALFSKRVELSETKQGDVLEDELPKALIDRPKMLKLYEPMIEENFDGNRKRKQKRKGMTQEESRLNHKVKKEAKSAAREILKDNAFLAKQLMKEQAMKDAERSRRVKELLGSLSNQEGDYRRLKRQN